ncbi:MAG: DUF3035 domain-containing protein [Candidatus Pacebacteria bacterium]|nr:DUF3035 domain-containing protein [Candidatus Paceibacterota bacterium]
MQYHINRIAVVMAVVGVTVLAGCTQQARRSIGLERTPPDEFLVDRHMPLVIPPDFGLRPPVPVTSRTVTATPDAQGKAVIIKNNDGAVAVPKKEPGAPKAASDIALLKAAGALNSNDAIRTEIDRDLRQRQAESPEMVKKLVTP